MRGLLALLTVASAATVIAWGLPEGSDVGKAAEPSQVLFKGHSPAYWHYRAGVAEQKRQITLQKLRQTRVVLKKGLGPYKTRPPHYNEWMCIHKGEGSWTDPNAPYYGGLQMDMSFMRTYGWHLLQTKGTADNWTPLEQMWVAERAWASGRGFYPWPNTARWCGLI